MLGESLKYNIGQRCPAAPPHPRVAEALSLGDIPHREGYSICDCRLPCGHVRGAGTRPQCPLMAFPVLAKAQVPKSGRKTEAQSELPAVLSL